MPPLSRPSSPQISLSKGDEYWWNAVLEGEEQIDIDKINKERSMATVDEEEHAVLDRLTFDYHQKLQGKPQSHELVGAGHQPGPSRGPSAGDGGIPLCCHPSGGVGCCQSPPSAHVLPTAPPGPLVTPGSPRAPLWSQPPLPTWNKTMRGRVQPHQGPSFHCPPTPSRQQEPPAPLAEPMPWLG